MFLHLFSLSSSGSGPGSCIAFSCLVSLDYLNLEQFLNLFFHDIVLFGE